MKKKSLLLTLITILSTLIIFISCSSENELTKKTVNKISNKYAVSIDNNTNKVSIKDYNISSRDSDNQTTYEVENLITLDESMPEFNSENELIDYVNNNPELLIGHYELIIDDVLVYSSDIVGGIETNIYKLPNTISTDPKPCSYEGIRRCAVKRIHDMNWLDKWTCIAEGLNCVLYQMASCAVDNC